VLDVVLDDERRQRMVATGTRDPNAFLYYLRGRAEYEAAHAEGLETNDRLWEANRWFEQALQLDPDFALARFYHHDAYGHAIMGDIAVPPALRLPDGSADLPRIQRLMQEDLAAALASGTGTPHARTLSLIVNYQRGEWTGLAAAVAALDEESASGGVETVDGGWLWFPTMIVRAAEPARRMHAWMLRRNPLDAGIWSQVIDGELLAGDLAAAERALARATELELTHRFLDESRVRLLIASGRAREVLEVEVPRMGRGRVALWASIRAHAELGNVAEARALLEAADRAFQREEGCWVLARIGDQEAANQCAARLDAEPQGWVRLTRLIVNGGSVPFDPGAAPRFTALYRASGAPPWPRTEAVGAPGGAR
jgi:tetratricopeptide (TPR) repeat protein